MNYYFNNMIQTWTSQFSNHLFPCNQNILIFAIIFGSGSYIKNFSPPAEWLSPEMLLPLLLECHDNPATPAREPPTNGTLGTCTRAPTPEALKEDSPGVQSWALPPETIQQWSLLSTLTHTTVKASRAVKSIKTKNPIQRTTTSKDKESSAHKVKNKNSARTLQL